MSGALAALAALAVRALGALGALAVRALGRPGPRAALAGGLHYLPNESATHGAGAQGSRIWTGVRNRNGGRGRGTRGGGARGGVRGLRGRARRLLRG